MPFPGLFLNGFLIYFGLLNILKNNGSAIIVSIVEVINPPMTTVASGLCTSAPAPVEIAIGKKPIAAAAAVSITGRSRSLVPLNISSFMS